VLVAADVRVCGPLTEFASGFIVWLAEQGYSAGTQSSLVERLGLLSRWMIAARLGPADLDEAVIERLLRRRHRAGGALWLTRTSFRRVLAFLRSAGASPAVPAVVTPLDELLGRFEAYLADELGLMPSTIKGYVYSARKMLEAVCDGDVDRIAGLTATDVSGFVIGLAKRGLGAAAVTTMVVGTRSLFRWLYSIGAISTPLAQATPWLARARMASLPRTVDREIGARLLASCDTTRVAGARDFALLVLFCRLGLRVGEAVALEIDDIDWRRGELLVRSKGGWRDPLPLPVDVGEALAAYLAVRGPSTISRNVFLKVRAPHAALNAQAAKAVVRHACERIGIPAASTHCLRHSVAADLLREGASLPEIGQVLRHREIATTAIYAKVDHSALAGLAQPWPVTQ
jgi:integrase/recombinase XerD